MTALDSTLWRRRLQAASAMTTQPPPSGVARWFQCWRGAPAPASRATSPSPDEQLWRLLTQSPQDLALQARNIVRATPGALLGSASDFGSIELWTECELSALHALSRIATRSQDQSLVERVASAARFHLDETQPDNATNRPWSIHVFALIAVDDADPEADLYAQTLLHNCMVQSGRPDPLSALILTDAAECLAHARAASDPAHLSEE